MYRPPGVDVEQRRLLNEKRMLEQKFEELRKLLRSGGIGEQEYAERMHSIEREFVEVMDRLAQMRFLSGEEQG